MPPTLVLVHSPLVGPATWEPVAHRLRRRDIPAIVPNLNGMAGAEPPRWRAGVSAVTAAVEESGPTDVVLVGHSAAGPLLPAIGAALPVPVKAYVFVDAGLPPSEGVAPLAPPSVREFLARLAVDGRLPRWSDWWGPEVMAELVPDEATRARVEAEIPELPLAYFDEEVVMPPGWAKTPCAYVQLSAAYEAEAEEAAARGWPVERIDAAHLHAVVDPPAVADRVLLVLDRLGVARR